MWFNHFSKTKLYKSLNEQQKLAIQLEPHKHGLVIAGAGAGKTKTLITRICALIQSNTFQPQEIVALTFTNKAAFEMKARLQDILKEQANLVNIHTFHSFALKLIKEDKENFGFTHNITLLTENEQRNFIKSLFYENNWEDKNNAIDKLLDYINSQKEHGIRSNSSLYRGKGIKTLINQYKVYEQKLKDKSFLDFSELILLLNERLTNDVDYKEKLQEQYKTFLIDEFQDTNPIQYNTLLLLTEDKSSIFAVGDDSQSIYSFRGAEVKNVIYFKEKVKNNFVLLEQNYRSSKNIVEISNYFISFSEERIEKKLFTENEDGKPIYIYKAKNEYEEADFIVSSIENLMSYDIKTKYSDFCILYRGNAQSARIETALTLRKIPFKVSGGMSFFEKEEIKTLLACAKILIEPNHAPSFIRIIDKLKTIKINKKILNGWQTEAELEKLSFSELIRERKSIKYPELLRFYDLIQKGQEEFKFSSLKESFEEFLFNIGFFNYIHLSKNPDLKLKSINFFLSQVEQYEQDGGTSFQHFFYTIEQTLNLIQENDNVVNLMTIHASKGLEFNYTFLTGVEDGVIPSSQSIENNNIDEERRLMYVAITRAKKELYLSFCEERFNGYEKVNYLPSRFLLNLPENYLHPINTIWLPEPPPYSHIPYDSESNFVNTNSSFNYEDLSNQLQEQHIRELMEM